MKKLCGILLLVLPTVQIISMDYAEMKQEWQRQALYALDDMNIGRFTLYFRALPTLEDTKPLFFKALMLRFNITDLGISHSRDASINAQAEILNHQQVTQQQTVMDSFKTTLLKLSLTTYDFPDESINQSPSSLMHNYLKTIAEKVSLKLRNQDIRCASDLFTQDELALFHCHNLLYDKRSQTDISNKGTIECILQLLSALETSTDQAKINVIKNFLQLQMNSLLNQKQYPIQHEVCFSAFDKNTTDEEKNWYYQATNALLKIDSLLKKKATIDALETMVGITFNNDTEDFLIKSKAYWDFLDTVNKLGSNSSNTSVKNRLVLLAQETKNQRLMEQAQKLIKQPEQASAQSSLSSTPETPRRKNLFLSLKEPFQRRSIDADHSLERSKSTCELSNKQPK